MEVIKKVLDNYMSQRAILVSSLGDINFNEPSSQDKKMTIDKGIIDIDMQVNNILMTINNNNK